MGDTDVMGTKPKDAALEAAQREFTAADASADAWALKPTETVCTGCFLVKPCECDDVLSHTILTVH